MALIANTAWLDEELAAFRHLVVGLIDEQVQVTQVVPESLAGEESSGFCERVTWQDSRWSVVRERRLYAMADRLEELGVELIHALDGRVWQGGLRLAKRLGLPAVLGAWSVMDMAQAERVQKKHDMDRVVFVTPTGPLALGLQKALAGKVHVELVPQGVHVPDEPREHSQEPGDLCAVVAGNGTYDPAYDALITAMRAVVTRYPQAQFFFDGQGSDQHLLWQNARRHGLLSNMSLVPRRLGRRELLLRADVLIHPQALGKARTLTLAAMANGLPVMALQDPWLDYLVDQQTAWVVDRPDPQRWEQLILQLIEDPSGGQRLGERARQWIRQRHLAAVQVEHLLAVYRQLSGQPFRFPGAEVEHS